MGAYASNFREDQGNLVADFTNPSKPDWITAHAAATGLTVVEVERLWKRFEQLGSNKHGIVTEKALKDVPITSDVFAKNILSSFKAADGSIHFQAFVNAMKWVQASHVDDKIKGVFNLINGGKPLTGDVFERVLRRIYPDDSDEAIKRTAKVFFEQMDSTNKGHITEEDFLLWVRKMPDETLSGILDFHIVPPALNDEAQRLFNERNLGDEEDPLRPDSEMSLAQQIPSDALLRQVAERAQDKDWSTLADKLGITAEERNTIQRENPDNSVNQVFKMLQFWRDRQGNAAKASVLEKALRDSQMNDIALLLYP